MYKRNEIERDYRSYAVKMSVSVYSRRFWNGRGYSIVFITAGVSLRVNSHSILLNFVFSMDKLTSDNSVNGSFKLSLISCRLF